MCTHGFKFQFLRLQNVHESVIVLTLSCYINRTAAVTEVAAL
jgi:hypothetical protein